MLFKELFIPGSDPGINTLEQTIVITKYPKHRLGIFYVVKNQIIYESGGVKGDYGDEIRYHLDIMLSRSGFVSYRN